jgi:hypothetical protein
MPAPTDTEESGYVNLTVGQVSVDVGFIYLKTSAAYAFEALYVENTVDANPLFLGPVPTARSTSGFTILLAAAPDTANYVLKWHIKV